LQAILGHMWLPDSRCGEVIRIVGRMPGTNREPVLRALRAFSVAAGEVPGQDWSLGWRLPAKGISAPERRARATA
jgi:hypothetical protein